MGDVDQLSFTSPNKESDESTNITFVDDVNFMENQNVENVAIESENDDLMTKFFKEMEVLHTPANISLFLTSYQLKIRSYESRLERFRKEKSELFEANQKAELEKLELKAENRQLSQSLEKMDKICTKIREHYNTLVDTCSQLNAKAAGLEGRYDLLQNSNSWYKEDDDVKALKKNHADLEQLYGNLVLNLEAVTDEMKKIGETNEQLQEKLHTSEEHAKNVENLLQNQTHTVSTFQTKEEQIKQYINHLRGEFVRISNENESQMRELKDALSLKDQELEQRRVEHENQLNVMHGEMDDVQKAAKEAVSHHNNQEDMINSLNEQIKTLKQETEKYRTANAEVNSRVRDADSGSELEELKEAHKVQCETFNSDLKDMKQQLSDSNRRELDLQKKLNEMEREYKSAKKYIQFLERRPQPLQKFSTPKRSILSPTSPGFSPISDGEPITATKKLKLEGARSVPVATVTAAKQKPLLFQKPSSSTHSSQMTTDGSRNPIPSSSNTLNEQNNEVPIIDLDSSDESVAPPNPSRRQNNQLDVFDLLRQSNLSSLYDDGSDSDESCFKVQVNQRNKKKR